MNFLYAINFAPGFEELVSSLLIKLNADILEAEEGFILTRFNEQPDIAQLRFAKGVIEVFDWDKDFSKLKLEIPEYFSARSGKKFNLRSFEAGRPSRLETTIREALIRSISKVTGLTYSSYEPELDFVLMQRRDGLSYFGFKRASGDASGAGKGEIHSDVANLLLELGDLKHRATVLDAFCGQAGIAKEVLATFEPGALILTEKESHLVNNLKKEFREERRVKVVASDAVNFLKNDQTSFDLIIADPPWGEFVEMKRLGPLYEDFLSRAEKSLADGGCVVIMSSAKKPLRAAASKTNLRVLAELNVLISGKKVLVLKLSK